MKNNIIQDYGKTVTPELYINALQGHQYIPQSDQCIFNIIKKHVYPNDQAMILDLGCGPGRVTWRVAQVANGTVVGIDISQEFIQFANSTTPFHKPYRTEGSVFFSKLNFAENTDISAMGEQISDFDVILMQGVMHHVHGRDRVKFLSRSFELLKPNGILIIGDEFIKNYNTEAERKLNVCKFYLHIIDEARKGGFNELAEEEAKNLIDDVLFVEETAGFGNEELFQTIYEKAELANKGFYTGAHQELDALAEALIRYVREKTKSIARQNSTNFNRGDLKVSTKKFTNELKNYGFVLEEKYEIGPVDVLGGMGVLVFMKR